jgi:sulfate transport system ATP-binding protein
LDIRIVGITKEFGATEALREVSLDVRSGELVALLGPSGSGKTTLLRVIAGLERPTSGRVLFADEDATALPVQSRRIGFVFQHYALFKHMSVFENVAYGLRVRPRAERPASAEIRRRVHDLLDLVQLPGMETRYPAQLSGGQRQRVALARALAVDPRVLLLDEPFGALDARVRKDLRRWLRQVHEQVGRTTIFVTHDQEEALELADRVAILNEGRLEQIGTADEIYDQPASPFAMTFVGDTMSIPVEVRSGHAVLAGRPLATVVAGKAEGPAQLYFRPGEVVLIDHDPDLRGIVAGMRRTTTGRRFQVKLHEPATVIEVDTATAGTVKIGDMVGLQILRGRVFAQDQ